MVGLSLAGVQIVPFPIDFDDDRRPVLSRMHHHWFKRLACRVLQTTSIDTVIERRSVTAELSVSYARPIADG